MVNENVGSLIVSWDFSNNRDKAVLLVGEKPEGRPVQIVNVLVGEDARAIRDRLITKKERYNG